MKTKNTTTRAARPAFEIHVHPHLMQIRDSQDTPVAVIQSRDETAAKLIASALAYDLGARRKYFDAAGLEIIKARK